jgi:Skp family chaperone for outer membrane proteins
MKAGFSFILVLVASTFLISGCDQISVGGSDVVIIDLTAVAKATGQDEVIRLKAEAARDELTVQLQQLIQGLEQQLADERAKMGDNPSPEQAQVFQQLNIQARGQLTDAQAQAQAQATQIEQALVAEFRDSVSPLAEEIARGMGASAVLAADPYLFWFDPAVDITDEVIAAWRARPAKEPAAESSEEVTEEMTDVQSELNEVEDELTEAEEELAEVQEEIEELKEAVKEAAIPAAE